MVFAIAIGYLVAAFSMYAYLVATAEECTSADCFDCRELSCDSCPIDESSRLAA